MKSKINISKILIGKVWGIFYFYGGIFHLVRFINNILGKRLTIVTYHRITDKDIGQIELSLPYLFTSQRIFEKQLGFFKKWYKVITFKDLSTFASMNKIPWNCLIITFDDGYEDNYHHAYPILQNMNLPATYFIVADLVGNHTDKGYWWDRAYYYFSRLAHRDDSRLFVRELNPEIGRLYEKFKHDPSALFSQLNKWDSSKINGLLDVLRDTLPKNQAGLEQENPLMNWEEINSMCKYAHFGSHTSTHANLAQADQARKTQEIDASKIKIEKNTKQLVTVFSYPCGNYNNDIKTEVQRAGYEFAVTTEVGVNCLDDRYALKRINVWEGSSLSIQGSFSKGFFAFILSGCKSK